MIKLHLMNAPSSSTGAGHLEPSTAPVPLAPLGYQQPDESSRLREEPR